MSFLQRFLEQLRHRVEEAHQIVDPPIPAALPKVPVHVVVWGTQGIVLPTSARIVLDDGHGEDGTNVDPQVHFELPAGTVVKTEEHGGWQASLLLKAPDYQDFHERIELAPNINVRMQPAATARPGIVRVIGKSWQDDAGPFFPFITSLMWAVGGWHRGEVERVKQNLAYIGKCGLDGYRAFGQVDWSGDDAIDPFWLDYRDTLAAVIDYGYDTCGLRMKLTAFAGHCADYLGAAAIMRDVVAPRRHKVILIEAANEDKGPTMDEAIAIARLFAPLGIPNAVGLGNQDIQNVIKAAGNAAGANVDCLHSERTPPAERQVRQCWDFHLFDRASDCGEPPGPGSSVGQLTDPFQLAALRAGMIICGAEMVCAHFGSGVNGHAANVYGVRYANLWEEPRFAEIITAMRNAAAHLPAGMGNWQKFNTNHEVDVTSGDLSKLYGCRDAGRFAEIAIGCTSPVTFRATKPCHLKIVSPATADVLIDHHFNAGETQRVDGLWSYVLIGEVG